MAPLTYPSRVAWQFRNVTRSYDFWPRLETISITEANPEDLAVFSGDLVDELASITMAEEDEVWVKIAGSKAFGGHINSLTRTEDSEVGPRVYRFSAQDYTLKLDDSVIDHPKARGKESLAARVAWVLSFLDYGITTGGVSLPSEDSERAEYDGMTVREALDQLSDEHRLFYYVDFDKDLHIFRTETISAPFELDDLTPDYAASFPYSGFEETGDTVELAQRIYVIGSNGRTWVGSGSQERSINDPELVTATQRTRAGDRAIAELGTRQIDGQLLCHEPGLRGGMSFLLSNDLWGLDGVTRIATQIEMTAVDPHDDDGKAYLHTQVEFSDRRRARPRKKRGAKPEDGEVVDGASVAATRWGFSADEERDDCTGGLADSFAFGAIPGASTLVQSATGHQTPGIFVGGTCSSPDVGYSGIATREQWVLITGTPGADAVGLKVEYTIDPSFVSGVAAGGLFVYGVASVAPTNQRGAFEVLGYCTADDDDSFVVPTSLAMTGGYIVIGPAWQCANGANACSDEVGDPVVTSFANSGRSRIDTITVTEVTIEGSGDTSWRPMTGDIDGVNKAYTLPDWNGRGSPRLRIGPVEYALGTDYTIDRDAGTATFRFAPWAGADLNGRWDV